MYNECCFDMIYNCLINIKYFCRINTISNSHQSISMFKNNFPMITLITNNNLLKVNYISMIGQICTRDFNINACRKFKVCLTWDSTADSKSRRIQQQIQSNTFTKLKSQEFNACLILEHSRYMNIVFDYIKALMVNYLYF